MVFQYTDTCKATPETIWETCFADMKWESWDADVEQVLDVSGGCENGTTFTFKMKTGQKIKCTLSEVVKNQSVTFSGPVLPLGAGIFSGTILVIPIDDEQTKIDYIFSFEGLFGWFFNFVANKPADKGTKEGLENMIRISEEAQQAKN